MVAGTDSEPERGRTTTRIAPGLGRWLAPAFLLAGIGLVPWTIYLVATLPARHVQIAYYDVAWGGFDVALAAVLVATGVGLARRKAWVQITATAAGTLLVCDAWFDVLSSSSSGERLEALLLAFLIELPAGALCFLVALHADDVAESTQSYALVARRLRGRRHRADDPQAPSKLAP
ncbi:MAG TPA: hypothetical protein VFK76_09955 [Gaiellaceae bacterium]|nr:hypothetical protein [Gaiellaceae bacterium]